MNPNRRITIARRFRTRRALRPTGRMGGDLDRSEAWPAEQLRLCGEAGVFGWFVPSGIGGAGVERRRRSPRGYLAPVRGLPDHDLHHHPADRGLSADRRQRQPRRSSSGCCPIWSPARRSPRSASRISPPAAAILAKPVLRPAKPTMVSCSMASRPGSPGPTMPAVIVTGAALDDGRQILVALPTDLPGRDGSAAAATGRPLGQPHRRSAA